MNQDSTKVTEACVESGMGLKGIEHWKQPLAMMVNEWNQLLSKHRISKGNSRMGFIKGLGWRRIILVKTIEERDRFNDMIKNQIQNGPHGQAIHFNGLVENLLTMYRMEKS